MKAEYPFNKKKEVIFGYTNSLNFLISAITFHLKVALKRFCMCIEKIANKTITKYLLNAITDILGWKLEKYAETAKARRKLLALFVFQRRISAIAV